MAFKFWSKVGLPKVSLRKSWWIARPPSHPFPQSSLQNQTCTQCYAPNGYMLVTVTQNTHIVCWKCKLKRKQPCLGSCFLTHLIFQSRRKQVKFTVQPQGTRPFCLLSSLHFGWARLREKVSTLVLWIMWKSLCMQQRKEPTVCGQTPAASRV